MTYWSTSFDCEAHFIKEGRWDILAEGLRSCMSSLHEEGLLTLPVKKVTAGMINAGETERFDVLIELEDKE